MESEEAPDLGRVTHQPIFLLPYTAHDGPHAGDTDCRYLSLGWAQYDLHSASLKTLRHTGSKWSRQSEEIPLHRAVDLVILLTRAIRHMAGPHLGTVTIPAGTLENQPAGVVIPAGATSPAEDAAFSQQIANDLVKQRLRKLRDELNELHDAGKI